MTRQKRCEGNRFKPLKSRITTHKPENAYNRRISRIKAKIEPQSMAKRAIHATPRNAILTEFMLSAYIMIHQRRYNNISASISYHIKSILFYILSYQVKTRNISVYISLIQRLYIICLLYTSPSPRDGLLSRMPSSA